MAYLITATRTVPRVPGPPTITHGRQITTANTGFTAYYDSSLGRNLTLDDLIVHESRMSLSDFTDSGGTISGHWFKGGCNIDLPDCTVEGCFFNAEIYVNNVVTLNYITVNTLNPGDPAFDEGIAYGSYTAHRCQIGGGSDGVKTNGNAHLTECYIRTKGQAADDHCDGVQNNAGSGDNSVIRCNIDSRPVNGVGLQTAALFCADGATGLQTWKSNYCAGGGYTIRAHESATYVIDDNDVLQSAFQNGPFLYTNTPVGNIEWGTNRVVDDSGNTVYLIEFP